jgi:hypothetical protein
MNVWSINPVGGIWLVLCTATLLGLLLVFAPGNQPQRPSRRWSLLALRALTLVVLLFAMLRPARILVETRQLPGVLILLLDSSRSMQVADSLDNRRRWDALRATLSESSSQLAALANTWKLDCYRFDQHITPVPVDQGRLQLPQDPDGGQSAIGAAIEDVLQRQTRQRIAAVLLLGDGAQRAIAPRDLDPQTATRRLATDAIPLYTFTFGQPAHGGRADLRLTDLLASHVVFAETPTQVQALVGTEGYAGQTFKVQLLWEDSTGTMQVADTREVLATADPRQIPVSFTHTPKEPGEFKVTVQIETADGEMVTSNNLQSTFVTVIGGGIQVLYLAGTDRSGGGPGIEPRFVRAALAAHADIHIDFELINYRQPRLDIRDRLERDPYNIFLLANLDAAALSSESWQLMAEQVERGAGLAMTGGLHSFGPGGYRGTPLEKVLPVRPGQAEKQNFNDPPRIDMHLRGPLRMVPVRGQLGIHPILQIGTSPEETLKAWRQLPPLPGANRLAPNRLRPNAQTIAQAEGSGPGSSADWPLMVTGGWGEGRTLALAVDETWRWQMGGASELQRRFWRQLILWLSKKDQAEGEKVWLRLDQRRVGRGSRVGFTLGATDAQGNLASGATFQVQVTLPDGTTQAVQSTRRGDQFSANYHATDQPGDYTVTVVATEAGQPLGEAKARFTIPDQDMELNNPAAEPTRMRSLAAMTTGGKGLAPEQFGALLEELETRKKDFQEEIVRKVTLWDTWPVFLILVMLLGLEWWLRKRWGMV